VGCDKLDKVEQLDKVGKFITLSGLSTLSWGTFSYTLISTKPNIVELRK